MFDGCYLIFSDFTVGVWDIWTVTGDGENEGLRTGVKLTLCGGERESEQFTLTPLEGEPRPFQRGATDRFVVSSL